MKKSKIVLTIIVPAALLLAAAAVVFLYVNDYYRASDYAAKALVSDQAVEVLQMEDGTVAFVPDNPEAGLIFYPGENVEYTAYAPLMHELAERDILCVLVEMPCNLAVLDVSAATGIPQQYPEIDVWYIGGHSLGGSVAASYLAKHRDEYNGLILLSAYSTVNLSQSDMTAVSLYGSEDGILNMEKYQKYAKNLPQGTLEQVIEGGCHAFFGSYGVQEGDGNPKISNEEQIEVTADICANVLSLH